MRVSTTIDFKNHYVYVRRLENADLEEFEVVWRRIVAECQEHHCFNILVESFITKIPIKDNLLSGEIFDKVGLNHRYRIAWVHHQKESLEDIKLKSVAIKKQGIINGRLFPNIEEALEWLLLMPSNAD